MILTLNGKKLFWFGAAALAPLLLFLLRDVLPPFLLGAGAAYFLDPLCDRLERRGFSRTAATCIVTAGFFLLVLLALALALPVLLAELRGLLPKLQGYAATARGLALSFAETARDNPLGLDITDWTEKFSGIALDAVRNAAGIASRLLVGMAGFLDIATMLVLTPVVTFYMLRDWDRIVSHVESWIPRPNLADARGLARDADFVLGGFLRGQLLVCLVLGLFYATGLTLAGLDFGFAIGLATGLLSFIPWFGMLAGFALGMIVAVLQFGAWMPVAVIAGVFAAGQVLEGYVLTPRLLGSRVGLHPVWILFALMAGGSLAGFSGMLVAVPVAAVCGVGARFLLARYRNSTLYAAGKDDAPPTAS